MSFDARHVRNGLLRPAAGTVSRPRENGHMQREAVSLDARHVPHSPHRPAAGAVPSPRNPLGMHYEAGCAHSHVYPFVPFRHETHQGSHAEVHDSLERVRIRHGVERGRRRASMSHVVVSFARCCLLRPEK